MEGTWVVTADRAGARLIARNRDKPEGYDLIEEVAHPEGRLRDSELETDRPGRASERGGGIGHAMAHDHVAVTFARSIAAKLQHARTDGLFDRLVLAAEPRFLGMLREALDVPTTKCVVGSVSKNLQRVSLGDLDRHLNHASNA
jgi:protein required for attachment to host cells